MIKKEEKFPYTFGTNAKSPLISSSVSNNTPLVSKMNMPIFKLQNYGIGLMYQPLPQEVISSEIVISRRENLYGSQKFCQLSGVNFITFLHQFSLN